VKKALLIITLLSTATAFGVVREDDPSYTPEQRQQARAHNERMAQRDRERRAEKTRQLEALAQKYKDVVENVKKSHKDDPEFHERLAMAELEELARYDPEIQKYLDEANAVREKYRPVMG